MQKCNWISGWMKQRELDNLVVRPLMLCSFPGACRCSAALHSPRSGWRLLRRWTALVALNLLQMGLKQVQVGLCVHAHYLEARVN